MNENNVDYLINQVKFTGFGDSLEFKLKENIAKGEDAFQLTYKPEFGKDKAEATLHFRKSEQGNFFFNKYDLAMAQEKGEPLVQTFTVSGSKQIPLRDENGKIMQDNEGKDRKEWINNTFTLKEAFNMMDVNHKMEGRSVLKDFVSKEGNKHTFWNKLDFSNKDKYGNYEIKTFKPYELEGKLSQFPIKEMTTEKDRQQLIDSLQKGNRQAITMVMHDGTEERRSIEANAQFKTITQYIGNQRVSNEIPRKVQEESTGENKKQDQSSRKNVSQKSESEDTDNEHPQKNRKEKKGVKAT